MDTTGFEPVIVEIIYKIASTHNLRSAIQLCEHTVSGWVMCPIKNKKKDRIYFNIQIHILKDLSSHSNKDYNKYYQ